MYTNTVLAPRLQHTNIKIYGNEGLFSSITANSLNLGINNTDTNFVLAVSGNSLFYNDVTISGTLSAQNVFFTSITSVQISISSQELNFLGSVSITGDNINPISQHLFQVYRPSNNIIPVFYVSSAGLIGIETKYPSSKLSISGDLDISGSFKNYGINGISSPLIENNLSQVVVSGGIITSISNIAISSITAGIDFSLYATTAEFVSSTAFLNSNLTSLSSYVGNLNRFTLSADYITVTSNFNSLLGNLSTNQNSISSSLTSLSAQFISATASLTGATLWNSSGNSIYVSNTSNNIGIGTSAGNAKVNILGNLAVTGSISATNGASISGNFASISGWVGIGAKPLTNYSLYILNTSQSPNSTGLYISKTGAIAGTVYGASIVTEGYGIVNYGGYFSARGALTNRSIYVPNNNTFGTTNDHALYIEGARNNYFAGNIGINTIIPTEKLSVSGNTSITGDISVSGNLLLSNNKALQFKDSFGTITDVIKFTSSDNLNIIAATGTDTYIGYNYAFVQKKNGQIGIGTPIPTEKLSVSGNISTTGNLLITGDILSTTGGADFAIKRNSVVNGWSTFLQSNASRSVDGGGAYIELVADGAGNSGRVEIVAHGVGSNSNVNSILFKTRETSGTSKERLRISASGNVGIGTPIPTEKLSVSGNISATGNIVSSTASNVGLFVLSTGNIGIGTSAASENLHVVSKDSTTNTVLTPIRIERQTTGTASSNLGAALGYYFQRSVGDIVQGASLESLYSTAGDSSQFIFKIRVSPGNLSEVFRFNNTGNFGINTNSPTEKLSISGNISNTGNIISSTSSNIGLFVLSSGRVGINQSTPTVALEVSGSLVGGQSFSLGKGGNMTIGYAFNRHFPTGAIYDSTRYAYQFTRKSNADRLHLEIYNGGGTLVNQTTFVIDNVNNIEGRIGIGTNSPNDKLSVRSGTSIGVFGVYKNNGNQIISVLSSDNVSISANTSISGNFICTTAINLGLYSLSTGNVGIGIASPTEKLSISGNIALSGAEIYSQLTSHSITSSILQSTQTITYMQGVNYIIAFNDAGTMKYRYMVLTGTDAVWNYSESAP